MMYGGVPVILLDSDSSAGLDGLLDFDAPRYTAPVSDPLGSVGTSRLTVPISDLAGQAVPNSSPWILAWPCVHASRPAAADGLSVMPSGSVIEAVLTCEGESSVGSFFCVTSVVSSSGSSLADVPPARL